MQTDKHAYYSKGGSTEPRRLFASLATLLFSVVSFPDRDRARAIEVTKMLVAYYSKGEVPVSNKYSVPEAVISLHDNLAIYLTNRLLNIKWALILCLWVGPRQKQSPPIILWPLPTR